MYILESKIGIKIALKPHPSDVAYCSLSVNLGTRDEPENKSGLVHLLEHMLFKGTSRRGAKSINNRLEGLGGELNAYTAKEELVIHSTVLKADMDKAVDLLLELIFDSVYPENELEKEKRIILEEIKSYKDNPSDAIFDHIEELIFEGGDLAKPILGTAKSLKKINRADILDFISSNFLPNNMVLTVLGDFDEKKVLKLVDRASNKYFKNYKTNSDTISSPRKFKNKYSENEIFKPLDNPFRKEISKKNYQGHAICAFTAYNLYDQRRVTLSLLTNILGGPALNSVLNQSLREKRGLVYNIEASYTPFRDNGLVTIYFGCDKANLDECESLVNKELDRFMAEPISDKVLSMAKRQILGQLAIANDNLEARVLEMGKSLIVYDKFSTVNEIRDKINNINSSMVQEVANEIFAQRSWLIYK